MTGPRLLAALAASVLTLLTCWAVPASADPGGSASPGEGAPGTIVQVTGAGWPAGTSVHLSVCGRLAVNGSVDCDAAGAVTAPVGPDGVVTGGLTIGAPPVDCPCVIRMATPAKADRMIVDVPFTVLGHPTSAVVKDAQPVRIDLVDAQLRGGGSWSELFGWKTRRTLVLTVRNNAPDPVKDAPLVVGWGADKKADMPLTAPPTGTIEPGATATFRVPIELPPASYGDFVVGGRFAGQTDFQVSFTTYPYLLFGLNLLALLALIAGVRAAIRRRRPQTRGAASASPPPASAPAAPRHLERAALLAHLDGTARPGTGDTLVIDRASLLTYLDGPPLLDPAALDRFLAVDDATAPLPPPDDLSYPSTPEGGPDEPR
ncbi:hypothetical protein EDD29_6187 [Actinocorallia herbida]|uniref:Neocarzinostatin family protein n=1 Tax=Actinocorallia herbida TaxID=58109 RepID=A0A3N1D4Y1_9ACTN|nr:hypothetical protein [Actinocorallia herbida]ROO88516.1 hypothetical protein EDD29_6187 [Actinocorallia herbida]